ncbi:hypothetical protein Y032_0001g181 [Ancylostoma ceylanicum]|uniref:CBS domain-containing protein n=1 Tax=Ancylostoma ceylanicum TaxID=53326 RepID=A0A016W2U0_9BILA|nr:hypothetical protein Y032_0001g181 [Ancylostoma ceylanicum]
MSHSESVSPLRSHLTLGSHTQSLRGPLRTVHGHAHTYSVRERSLAEVLHYEADSYARLLQMNQCYEAMPTSSKMVVFDTELVLWKAFNGLVYQNTRHVLLSNAERGGLITGILSVTDFIRVMLRLHRERGNSDALVDEKEDIGKLTIQKYRELVQKEGKLKDLVYINANNSLLEAARLLAQHRIHRLPVLDPDSGSPLFILTHKRLLKFLWCFGQQYSQPDFHIRTAKELNVGSWVGIRVVRYRFVFPDTPLTDCLDILLNKGVSGVPVVERDTFKVVDMYSRFDAVGIALEEDANSLDVTVEQALKFKNLGRNEKDRVVSVRDTDTLWKAVTVLVERNVHRLCAVNEKGAIEWIVGILVTTIQTFAVAGIATQPPRYPVARLLRGAVAGEARRGRHAPAMQGIISLSDVINHMVVKPGANLKPLRVPRRHYSHHPIDYNDKKCCNLSAYDPPKSIGQSFYFHLSTTLKDSSPTMLTPNSSWQEFEKMSIVEPSVPDRDLLARLLLSNSCYEAMPVSGRMIIFDQELLMWRAFTSLVKNESRHVLLSDSEQGGVITGILSVTDFIRALLKIFRENGSALAEEFGDIGLITIRQFRDFVHKAGKLRNLVTISAEDNLLDAVRMLAAQRVHRLPVLDPTTGNPVFMLTHKRILKFIWTFGQTLFHPEHFTNTPKDLCIGTWSGIRFVHPDTPLIDCLDILLNLGVSGVPVVEPNTQKVVDVYSRFDAIGVALENEGYRLHATVKEALEFKHICQNRRSRVVSVKNTETFYSVISVLVHQNVHRVCVVDENDVIQGIISLSDVLRALVVEPGKHLNSRPTAPRRVSQESFDLSNMELYIRLQNEKAEMESDEISEESS